MNKFQKLDSMTEKVAIIVPSTQGPDKQVTESEMGAREKTVLRVLAGYFGGASSIEQQGAWYSKDLDKTILEKNVMVYAYTDKLEDEDYDYLYELANDLKRLYEQEAIAVEINSKLYFV